MNGIIKRNVIKEEMLAEDIASALDKVEKLTIANNESYLAAGELVRDIKRVSKRITDYWEPVREKRYTDYKEVNDLKKEMLDPLENAEVIIKDKIAGFISQREEASKKDRDEKLKNAEKVKKTLMKKIDKLKKDGKLEEAEELSGQIEDIELTTQLAEKEEAVPKVKGISHKKKWAIKSIDPEKVPTDLMGEVIRPVDEKAVLKLIERTEGNLEIPGIEFEEKNIISIRA